MDVKIHADIRGLRIQMRSSDTPLETNIKHGYSLMVREVRGAILNPGAQISKARAEFMPPGAQSNIQTVYFPASPQPTGG